jgi:hypothetical protein
MQSGWKMIVFRRELLWACLLSGLGLFAFTGCGGNSEGLAPVSGTVTLDGAPLADAEVIFRPQSGRPSFGKTDAGGNYQLRYSADKLGALLGRHSVTISTAGDQPDDEDAPTGREKVPAEYNSRSTLNAEVTAGLKDPINFDLKTVRGR